MPQNAEDVDIYGWLERAIYDFFRFWWWSAIPLVLLITLTNYRSAGGDTNVLGNILLLAGWLVLPFIPIIALLTLGDVAHPIMLVPIFGIWLPMIVNTIAGYRLIPGWIVSLILCLVVIVAQVDAGRERPGGHFG